MSTMPAGADPAPETPDDRAADGDPHAGLDDDRDRVDTPESAAGPGDAAREAAPVDRARRRRLVAWAAALAAVVLVADQLTKWWALHALTLGQPVPVLGELLQLRLVFNDGAALGLGSGYTAVLTAVVVVVVAVILRAMRKIGSRGWSVALGLLLGGALGNLVDRLARDPGFARGHVVDMIDYAGFFVGNVADIAIVAAAGMIVVLSFRGIGLDGRRHADKDD